MGSGDIQKHKSIYALWRTALCALLLCGLSAFADEDYLQRPDRFCPRVLVECPSGRDLVKICGGGAACAFPNDGLERPKCTLVMNKDICDFFGFENAQAVPGSAFRKKTDCRHLSDEKLRTYQGNDVMLGCATVRHEYTHLSDVNAQSTRVGACTEQVAEQMEMKLLNAMFLRSCNEGVKGNQKIHCDYLCGIFAGKAAYASWDTLMCRNLKESIYRRTPVSRSDCNEAAFACEHDGYWRSLMPPYCQARIQSLRLMSTVELSCSRSPAGVHGCATYGGPVFSE